MSKEIISEIANRNSFFLLLQNNPGLIILKLGAKWCPGCVNIEKPVEAFFATSPPEVICGDIDVDKSFDFYSFLKSKKMVNGIPVLMCFKKGNATYIPDDIITGADPQQLHQFFMRCGNHLMEALNQNPPKQIKK
jgi:thioredoxin-like negative regulator of GroEL